VKARGKQSSSPETSVDFQLNTRRYIPEDGTLYLSTSIILPPTFKPLKKSFPFKFYAAF
jgi:hypothetical protein